MPKPNVCCNPLNKENHKKVYKNLLKVSDKYNAAFGTLLGKFICKCCKTQVYTKQKTNKETCKKLQNYKIICLPEDASSESDESDIDNIQCDPDFELRDQPPTKKVRCEESTSEENGENRIWINELKAAILNENSRSAKIALLTTIPLEWSISRMRKELNISKRLASKPKKLHVNCGYGARPQRKVGRKTDADIVETVEKFYLSEEHCSIMPGRKDYISVVRYGKRSQRQKRLLLHNIKNLHAKFKETFPEIKVSLSTFGRFRPRECILAGKSGTLKILWC